MKFIGESTLGEALAVWLMHLNQSNYYWPQKLQMLEAKQARFRAHVTRVGCAPLTRGGAPFSPGIVGGRRLRGRTRSGGRTGWGSSTA